MRLIDADELIEHAWRDKLDSRERIAEMIEKAPTIKEIPTKIPIHIFERLLELAETEDTMRKYQKIVDIVSLNGEEFKQCSLKELKEILEVIANE